jgi:DNA-binding beta-propeller fold protein YncE
MNSVKRKLVLILFFLVTACATHKQAEAPKIFYPPPPSLAHAQFLTFLTGEKDFVAKKSAFYTFVTGERQSGFRLDKPYGMAIADGKIYVCDVNQGLIVFDLEKKSIFMYPGSQGKGKLIEPLNIRIGADGSRYVTDVVRGQIIIFDKSDHFINAFSSPDEWKPVDAVPYEDQLFVIDMKNSQIVVMDNKTGAILRKIGQEGEPADRLVRPTNLAFDSQGHLFVSDMGRFQIAKYDRDGHRLGKVGEIGQESGTFARPKGVALDRNDRLYALDASFNNVQMFNKEGNMLFAFGEGGKRPGDMSLPAQVVVDYDNIRFFQKFVDPNFNVENLVFVTNQNGDMMVNVYAVGTERGKKYPTEAELLEELKESIKKKYEKTKAAEEKGEAAKEKP